MDEKPLLYKNRAGVAATIRVNTFSLGRDSAPREADLKAGLGAHLSSVMQEKCARVCFDCERLKIEYLKEMDMKRSETVLHARATCGMVVCPIEFKVETQPAFDEWGNLLPPPDYYTDERRRNLRAHAEYKAARAILDKPESNVVAW